MFSFRLLELKAHTAYQSLKAWCPDILSYFVPPPFEPRACKGRTFNSLHSKLSQFQLFYVEKLLQLT